MNSADKIFKMLAFQYKPTETMMLDYCKDHPDIIAKYQKANSITKIKMLDLFRSSVLQQD